MIYVNGPGGQKATVNATMQVNGDPLTVNMVNEFIIRTQPASQHGSSPLAYLYYAMLGNGFDVDIDPGDLEATELPENATP
jgi:hypothetical protein